MAPERTYRRWIGYDWFKLIIGVVLVLLMFWVRPGQSPTSAAAVPTVTSIPTTAPATVTGAAPTGTSMPTAPATVTVAAPTGTIVPSATVAVATSAPTPSPVATATPSPVATATPSPAATAVPLTISTPSDGQQLPVGPITIRGTGPAGAQIEIQDGDQVIGTLTIQDDQTWSMIYTPNGPGPASLAVRPKGGEQIGKPTQITIGTGVQAGCTTFALGCDAWVTRAGGLVLRMRAGPGTDQPISARLAFGTQLKLIEGPRIVNNLTWWRVATTNGREGWVNGDNLVLQPD